MPRSLAETKKGAAESASPHETQDILSSLAGSSGRKYRAKSGALVFSEPRSASVMIFGPQGSGKTYTIVTLLKSGLKVFALNTDFGSEAFATVYHYFKAHPQEAHLLNNFADIKLDAQGLMEFCRHPQDFEVELPDGTVTDLYTFDPDALFWDGGTAYQQVHLEGDICGKDDYLREDTSWKDFRSAQNGTLFPLDKFLNLSSKSGKPWHKFVTFLDKKDYERELTGEKDSYGNEIKRLVPGSNKNGPMLHTGARKISGAGFSICLESSVEQFDQDKAFWLTTSSPDKWVKSRGFELPSRINASKENWWAKYVAPKLTGLSTNVETKAEGETS